MCQGKKKTLPNREKKPLWRANTSSTRAEASHRYIANNMQDEDVKGAQVHGEKRARERHNRCHRSIVKQMQVKAHQVPQVHCQKQAGRRRDRRHRVHGKKCIIKRETVHAGRTA